MAGSKIRVQLADDHDVVIRGLVAILESEPDIEIVLPHIRSGEGLSDTLRATRPRVLLLDYRMPGLDMLAVLNQIRVTFPSLRAD
jgi:DNA-binding NarL/FixJ family response regulator